MLLVSKMSRLVMFSLVVCLAVVLNEGVSIGEGSARQADNGTVEEPINRAEVIEYIRRCLYAINTLWPPVWRQYVLCELYEWNANPVKEGVVQFEVKLRYADAQLWNSCQDFQVRRAHLDFKLSKRGQVNNVIFDAHIRRIYGEK